MGLLCTRVCSVPIPLGKFQFNLPYPPLNRNLASLALNALKTLVQSQPGQRPLLPLHSSEVVRLVALQLRYLRLQLQCRRVCRLQIQHRTDGG